MKNNPYTDESVTQVTGKDLGEKHWTKVLRWIHRRMLFLKEASDNSGLSKGK